MIRKYYGIILLFVTIVISVLFISWVISPMPFEKAQILEQQGHSYFGEDEFRKSYKSFLASAKIEVDNNKERSRRYRCAGTAIYSLDPTMAMKMFSLALYYNKDNINASNALSHIVTNNRDILFDIDKYSKKHISTKGSIVYINKSGEWSIGNTAYAYIYSAEDIEYVIHFRTINPNKNQYKVTVSNNNKLLFNKSISNRKEHSRTIQLNKGANLIKIEIDDTFVPKEVGINEDTRELGFMYELVRVQND